MATIRLALIPAKVLSDGSHKICIAIHHKEETKYIVTRFKVDSLSQFKNGQVVKRPDAALINTKLRNILNEYQEKLDSIKCIQGSFGVSPKKLLFLIMTALIVVGCSKSDEEKSDIQEIWLNGYKALTPESDYENISTTFLLFKADNNEEFDVKKQTFSGNILDYQKIQDETWNLLSKSKIKKKDGMAWMPFFPAQKTERPSWDFAGTGCYSAPWRRLFFFSSCGLSLELPLKA